MPPDVLALALIGSAAMVIGVAYQRALKRLLETFEHSRPGAWTAEGSLRADPIANRRHPINLLRSERFAFRCFRSRPDWIGREEHRWFRFLFALQYLCLLPLILVGLGVAFSRLH